MTNFVTLGEGHIYKDTYGKVYTSVTTLIEKYSEKFDTAYWSVYKALERRGYRVKPDEADYCYHVSDGGIYQKFTYNTVISSKRFNLAPVIEEVLSEWDDTRDGACARGTEKHEFFEQRINKFSHANDYNIITVKENFAYYSRKIVDVKELEASDLQLYYPSIYNYLADAITKGWIIYTEYRLFTEKYLVAGTADLIMVKDSRVIIVDWKTNKDEFHHTAGYYKKAWTTIGGVKQKVRTGEWVVTDDRLKYPLQDLPDCKLAKYNVQLSTYGWMLEQLGFKVVAMRLIHVRLTDKKEYPPKFYDLKYLGNEVEDMLEDHKHRQLSAA